ncbi:MAG: hypothetical protein QW177_08005 [Candidatus Nitrosotenuis sp.]
MIVRQVYPLLLAYAEDGYPIKGKTRLQKIIFLFQQEIFKEKNKDLGYNFVPYNFGPYSDILQKDVEELVDNEYLKVEAKQGLDGKYIYNYHITDKGRKLAENLLYESKYAKFQLNRPYKLLGKIKNDANYGDLDSLLKKVYSEHPEYAKNSIYEFD